MLMERRAVRGNLCRWMRRMGRFSKAGLCLLPEGEECSIMFFFFLLSAIVLQEILDFVGGRHAFGKDGLMDLSGQANIDSRKGT